MDQVITVDDMDTQEDIDALVAMMPDASDESSNESDSDTEDKENDKALNLGSSCEQISNNRKNQVEANNVDTMDKSNGKRYSVKEMEEANEVTGTVIEIKEDERKDHVGDGDNIKKVIEFHTNDMDSLEAINLLVGTSTCDSGGSENSESDSDGEDPIKTPIKSNISKIKDLDDENMSISQTLESSSVILGDKSINLDSTNAPVVTVEEFGFQSSPNKEHEVVPLTPFQEVSVLPDNQDTNEATFENIAVLNEEDKDLPSNPTSSDYFDMPTLSGGEQSNAVSLSLPTIEQFKASQMASQMKRIIKDIDEAQSEFSNEEMQKIIEDIDEAHSVETFANEDFEGENVQDLIIQDSDKTIRKRRYTSDYQYDDNIETSDTDMNEEVDETDDDDEYEICENNLDDLGNITGPVTAFDMQSYQYGIIENLQEVLASVEARLRENLNRQAEIDSLIQDNGFEGTAPSQPSGRHVAVAKKSLTVFGAPYFKDHRLFSHPKNADTLKKQSNNELDVYITYPHCWTTAKRSKLAASVREDAIKKRQKSLVEKRESHAREIKDVKDMGKSPEEKEEIRKLIQDIDRQLNEIAKQTDDKLFIDRDEDFDWMKISSQDFDEEFTAKGCELQWKNQLHPSINTGSFSKDEDELLKMLAQATEATDWDNIAKELGTGRTAIGCFMRYMEKHNLSVNNRRWESSEDERLRRIVASCRINNHIPWSKVSYYIENRTKDQCYQRYLYSLKDNLRQGTFAPAEDLLLIVGHKRYGPIWHKICETIPGRTPVQLHARWNAFLKVDFQSWTQEEDIQLLDLVHKNGMRDWVSIANQMTGRTFTRMQVRNRFQFIVRNYRRNPDFTLDQIKYKNTPGIAGRRKDDIWKTMRDKFGEWSQSEGLSQEDMAHGDPTGSIQLVDGVIVGNTYCDKFVRYLQKFLPEPEEPRPLAALQAPLPKAMAHLKEDVLGPVGKTVSNKLKLARKKKKFKKLPVQKRKEVYRNKLDRQIAEFLRCTWVGKGGRPKTNYNNEEIQQHTTAAIKLGQVLDFSKLNLNHSYHYPPPDEPIEPKELALFSAYKYYRKYGKHQNRYDPQTGLTTLAESPIKLPTQSPAPLKTFRTYSRKNKKGVPIPQVPSEPAVPQSKEMLLKEGEKRLTLLPPNQASMIGFRGQLLHTRYLSSLANPEADEEIQKSKTPSQATMEKMVQDGIYNSDLLLKIAETNGTFNNAQNDSDEESASGVEPGTPTQKQADELLVKRFTQIFLLPALLSCKKPPRQEQLFEESEFLNTEPVSAINPYDASDIIKGIEKPRVTHRKATTRTNVNVAATVEVFGRSEPIPSTSQRQPEPIPSTSYRQPEPIPSTSHRQPEPIPSTSHRQPEPMPSTSHRQHEPTRTPQSPQHRGRESSGSREQPSQATSTPLQPTPTSHPNQNPSYIYVSPQRKSQMSAIVQKPVQTPPGLRLSNNPSLQMTGKPQRYILLRQQPQSPQSNILQRPIQPLSKTTISPIRYKLPQNLPIPGAIRPSFPTVYSPGLPRTHLPSSPLPRTALQSQTDKPLVHSTPKQPSLMPALIPLQEEPTQPNRKRAASEQPVSDKDIPLKKRSFPPMRPPPPLSPNPATVAPFTSPKLASVFSPRGPSKSPSTFTSQNVPPSPRTPKGSKVKLSRTSPSVEVIHVFSGAQASPKDPKAAVLNINTGSPLCSQIKNTIQKQVGKDS